MGSVWKNVGRAAKKTVATLPFARRLVQFGGRQWGYFPQNRDVYSREAPSPDNPFNIFRNAWSSAVPGFKTGTSALFDDSRIKWLETQLGSFKDKRVLELGPLEGGHTFMMERAGARVIAIESNQRAFLKCLIIKDTFHLTSEFLYGDFRPYLQVAQPDRFDFVLASGVLYHMLEPAKLLHDIARVTDAFGLWTHYYDPTVIGAKLRFNPKPVFQTVEGNSVEVYEQHYLLSVGVPRFCGGSEPTSYWLTKDSLFRYVKCLGFQLEVGEEDPRHPNGPSILLYAKRT